MAEERPERTAQPGGSTGSDPAKARFYFIAGHRFVGAVLVILGMLAMQGALDWGRGLGKVLAATGLVVFFVVPLLLSRAWRTPVDADRDQ